MIDIYFLGGWQKYTHGTASVCTEVLDIMFTWFPFQFVAHALFVRTHCGPVFSHPFGLSAVVGKSNN